MQVISINNSVQQETLPEHSIQDRDGAYVFKHELWLGAAPLNLHDIDVVVIDLANLTKGDASEGTQMGAELAEFVAGGGVIICFAPTTPLSTEWLPGQFQPRKFRHGSRIALVEHDFRQFLEPFQNQISYECDFNRPVNNAWYPIAQTMANWPVAGVSNNMRVFMLPRVKRADRLIKAIFREVLPALLPTRLEPKSFLAEDPPKWLEEQRLPSAQKLQQQLETLEQRIIKNTESRDLKLAELDVIDAYKGLLWLKGQDHLEPLVRKALNLLGIPCKKEHPVDAVHRPKKGAPLYIEIEGSDNSIDVAKGRQLLGYIADGEDDPVDTRGAIIGNPFRKLRPDARPPENRPEFSSQLVRLAKSRDWALITTTIVYSLVSRHLAGDRKARGEMRRLLRL